MRCHAYYELAAVSRGSSYVSATRAESQRTAAAAARASSPWATVSRIHCCQSPRSPGLLSLQNTTSVKARDLVAAGDVCRVRNAASSQIEAFTQNQLIRGGNSVKRSA